MISKGLLGEVLHPKCILTSDKYRYEVLDNTLHFEILGEVGQAKADKINIHELVHKCKEWALSKGYEIIEYSDNIDLYDTINMQDSESFSATDDVSYSNNLTFVACEWILETVSTDTKSHSQD